MMSHTKKIQEGKIETKAPTDPGKNKDAYKTMLRHVFTSAVASATAMTCLSSNLTYAAEPTYKPLTGIGYSPFMNGQEPGGSYPANTNILQDLSRMTNIASEIRTYELDGTAGNIPMLCTNVGLYCWPGAMLIGVPSIDASTVNAMKAIAQSNYYTTKGFVVESDGLQNGILSPSQIATYMNSIKAVTTLPVTVAEPWSVWTNYSAYSRVITNVSGPFIVEVEPYWENQTAPNAASYVEARFNQVRAQYPTNLIIIGGAGWPTGGVGTNPETLLPESGVASEANQTLFMNQLTAWASTNLYAIDGTHFTNRTIVHYYEYRDENWRTNTSFDTEGSVGQYWGLTYAAATETPTTNKPALNSVLSAALKFTSLSPPSNNVATVTLGTPEGDQYTIFAETNLIAPSWTSVATFNGTSGTNTTKLNLTNSIFANPDVFLRAEYDFQ